MVVPRVQITASTFHQDASAGRRSKSIIGLSRPEAGASGLRVGAIRRLTAGLANACRSTRCPTNPLAPTSISFIACAPRVQFVIG